MYSSFFTLARKFSSALAIFLVAQVIGLAGYAPPVQNVVNGLTQLAPAAQSETFLLTLRLLFALLPAAMLVGGIVVARRYPLTRARHAELAVVLESRRADGARSPHPGQDLLAQELIGPG
jgi:Na+/melibiose symporter-like transporter